MMINMILYMLIIIMTPPLRSHRPTHKLKSFPRRSPGLLHLVVDVAVVLDVDVGLGRGGRGRGGRRGPQPGHLERGEAHVALLLARGHRGRPLGQRASGLHAQRVRPRRRSGPRPNR